MINLDQRSVDQAGALSEFDARRYCSPTRGSRFNRHPWSTQGGCLQPPSHTPFHISSPPGEMVDGRATRRRNTRRPSARTLFRYHARSTQIGVPLDQIRGPLSNQQPAYLQKGWEDALRAERRRAPRSIRQPFRCYSRGPPSAAPFAHPEKCQGDKSLPQE